VRGRDSVHGGMVVSVRREVSSQRLKIGLSQSLSIVSVLVRTLRRLDACGKVVSQSVGITPSLGVRLD